MAGAWILMKGKRALGRKSVLEQKAGVTLAGFCGV